MGNELKFFKKNELKIFKNNNGLRWIELIHRVIYTCVFAGFFGVAKSLKCKVYEKSCYASSHGDKQWQY